MKRNILFFIFIASVLLLTVSSCKQAAPTLIVNPPGVETSLASTARALAKQTEAANPFTATPSSTATQTPTPTPRVSVNGTSLVFRDDQSALFTDYNAQIQLVIPAGWMPLRVNEEEYYQAFTAGVVMENPSLSEHLTEIQDVNVDNFRLDAIDIREGHTLNGIPTDINVVFYPNDTRSLDQWAQAEGKRKPPFKNYLFLNRGYPKTADGTRVLLIDRTWSRDASNKVLHRSVYISLPTGTLILDLFTNNSLKDTVLLDFEQVVNSVTPLNP